MKTTLVLLLSTLFLTSCTVQTKSQLVEHTPIFEKTPATDSNKSYSEKLKSIETERENLAKEYRQSKHKDKVLAKATKLFVLSIFNEIFPAWYGTGWDFYGTTETPKQGKIACGYFVTTVLRDAGVKV